MGECGVLGLFGGKLKKKKVIAFKDFFLATEWCYIASSNKYRI